MCAWVCPSGSAWLCLVLVWASKDSQCHAFLDTEVKADDMTALAFRAFASSLVSCLTDCSVVPCHSLSVSCGIMSCLFVSSDILLYPASLHCRQSLPLHLHAGAEEEGARSKGEVCLIMSCSEDVYPCAMARAPIVHGPYHGAILWGAAPHCNVVSCKDLTLF